VVGAAFLVFLVLGLSDSPSTGSCLGETFLSETVFLKGVFWIGRVCLAVGSARAVLLPLVGVWAGETWGEPCSPVVFLVSLAGELSGEETISSTSIGYCSKRPIDLEVRGVLWEPSL